MSKEQQYAKELVEKYLQEVKKYPYNVPDVMFNTLAKQCALIALEEILILMPTSLLDEKHKKIIENPTYKFYQKVKQIILNM